MLGLTCILATNDTDRLSAISDAILQLTRSEIVEIMVVYNLSPCTYYLLNRSGQTLWRLLDYALDFRKE